MLPPVKVSSWHFDDKVEETRPQVESVRSKSEALREFPKLLSEKGYKQRQVRASSF